MPIFSPLIESLSGRDWEWITSRHHSNSNSMKMKVKGHLHLHLKSPFHHEILYIKFHVNKYLRFYFYKLLKMKNQRWIFKFKVTMNSYKFYANWPALNVKTKHLLITMHFHMQQTPCANISLHICSQRAHHASSPFISFQARNPLQMSVGENFSITKYCI